MKFRGLRTLARLAAGQQPGPEASIDKLFWSEYFKRLGEIAAGIEGTQTLIRPEGEGYPVTFWQDNFLAGRPASIYAGYERDPAQHHRRARPGPAQGAAHRLTAPPPGGTGASWPGRRAHPQQPGRERQRDDVESTLI